MWVHNYHISHFKQIEYQSCAMKSGILRQLYSSLRTVCWHVVLLMQLLKKTDQPFSYLLQTT